MENRLADQVQLLRMLAAKGIDVENGPEVKLLTKIINNEYDFGFRAAEFKHKIPTQREYGTGKHRA